MKKFENKVAIVTGAGIGIGFEIAKKFAEAGAQVVLNDLDPELTNEAANTISQLGGKCIGIAGDASNVSFIQELVDQTVQQFGKVDIAIPNAGITLFDNFLDYTEDVTIQVSKASFKRYEDVLV